MRIIHVLQSYFHKALTIITGIQYSVPLNSSHVPSLFESPVFTGSAVLPFTLLQIRFPLFLQFLPQIHLYPKAFTTCPGNTSPLDISESHGPLKKSWLFLVVYLYTCILSSLHCKLLKGKDCFTQNWCPLPWNLSLPSNFLIERLLCSLTTVQQLSFFFILCKVFLTMTLLP